MKKLLYLNNYNCTPEIIEFCKNLNSPRNHIWGVDFLQNEYELIIADIPFKKWKPQNNIERRIKRILTGIRLLFKYKKVDIVYSACNDYLSFFALMKLLHLSQKKLIKIIHHSTGKLFFPNQYNTVLYLSPVIKSIHEKNYPFVKKQLLTWGGDIQYFSLHYKEEKQHAYRFVSAGKSHRDYACFDKALEMLKEKKKKTLIISDKFESENPAITCISGSQKRTDAISYNALSNYYAQSDFIVIPIVSSLKKELCGLTSFVDAIILKKPVLISDNTNIGINFEELGLGWTYRAGDPQDMAAKLQYMSNLSETEYNQMKEKIGKFALAHNYENFAQKLSKIIADL